MPPKPQRWSAVDRALFLYGWRRSAKGNLWTRLSEDGPTITVFRKRQGGYGYCIYTDAPAYSPGAYETEQEAQEAAWDWLEWQREVD